MHGEEEGLGNGSENKGLGIQERLFRTQSLELRFFCLGQLCSIFSLLLVIVEVLPVGEYCHGLSFSLLVDQRLILPMDNTIPVSGWFVGDESSPRVFSQQNPL